MHVYFLGRRKIPNLLRLTARRQAGQSSQSRHSTGARGTVRPICIEEHIDVSLPPLKLQVLGEEISDIATLVDLVQRDDLVRHSFLHNKKLNGFELL